jgi:hypothetical protein
VVAITAVSLAVAIQPAEAGLLFMFEQVGPDLVVTGSGSINTTGTSSSTSAIGVSGFRNNTTGYISLKTGAGSPQPDVYNVLWTNLSGTTFGSTLSAPNQNPSSFNLVTGSTTSGDNFGFSVRQGPAFNGSNNSLWIPQGYVSGSPLSGTITFANTTLAQFGLTLGQSGTLQASMPAGTETITLLVVPEPTSVVVAGCSFVGIAALLRRRRGKVDASFAA